MSLERIDGISQDFFLGGRIGVFQPKQGYRAATDPVLLAAAVPAKPGQSVLDLGCGVGVASLCLAARVPQLEIFGLEIQPQYADLARQNAAHNHLAMQIFEGDVANPPAGLRARVFDHVLMNPPFHSSAVPPSPSRARDRAHRMDDVTLEGWIRTALSRLKPRGWLSIIHRAQYLPDILASVHDRGGDIRILPLAARQGRAAKRVIVRVCKGAGGPACLLAPLVMHAGQTHVQDGDDFTQAARAVLRDGQALEI